MPGRIQRLAAARCRGGCGCGFPAAAVWQAPDSAAVRRRFVVCCRWVWNALVVSVVQFLGDDRRPSPPARPDDHAGGGAAVRGTESARW